MTFNDRSKCVRYEKLLYDEIESINNEEGDIIDFSIEIEDSHYIKCPLDELDSE